MKPGTLRVYTGAEIDGNVKSERQELSEPHSKHNTIPRQQMNVDLKRHYEPGDLKCRSIAEC